MTREELQVVNEAGASQILDVPRKTLAHWRLHSKGPRFVKMDNGGVRYRLRDLDAYLEEKTVETTSKVVA